MQCLAATRSARLVTLPCKSTQRHAVGRRVLPVFKAIEESAQATTTPNEPMTSATGTAAAAAAPVEPVQSTLLGAIQEAANGRSAMLGFVAAVVSESITHQSVWSQIAGKYVDTELVEKPMGASSLYFFAIVILVSAASIVPRLLEDQGPESRSFGPFTPALEKTLGRTAMLGFVGWVLLEGVLNTHFL